MRSVIPDFHYVCEKNFFLLFYENPFSPVNQFFNIDVLKEKGFMIEERSGEWRMKTMQELMDKNVKEADIPKNLLHLFQVCTWDFGLNET